MALELHHLHPSHDDEVARLNARIAELKCELSDARDDARSSRNLVNDKNEEISELKDKIQQKDFFWEGCGFSKMGFKNTIGVANYVDSLKEENRKTKSSLWLMTAEWAEAMGLASCNIANKFMNRERFEVGEDYRNKLISRYRHRQVVFYKYADYCRQKAEEYK